MAFLKTVLKWLMLLAGALALLLAALVLLMPGIHISSLFMILNVMSGAGADIPEQELMARLAVPAPYHVSIYATDLPNPRFMARADDGTLLVSNPRSGDVIALSDSDGDGAADRRSTLLSGLTRPHGLALHGGYLYVAESDKVGRLPYDPDQAVAGGYEVIIDGLTDNGNHWSKSLAIGQDDKLYLSLGSTCNVCIEEDERRATIMQFDLDGGNGRIFATGLRNSVGLAFAPWNNTLYATDNGRDLLGDDYPPCELNRIVDGGFYGWPWYNGDNDPDPDFGAESTRPAMSPLAPVFNFRAHNAPLGIHFPSGDARSALVALHGSWNRSTPDGYKVVRLNWTPSGDIISEDFVTGFERDGDIVGRPVDIVGDGGNGFFISDDYAQVIYRVSPDRVSAHAGTRSASTDAAAPAPADIDPALAAMGKQVYDSHPCADCHAPSAPTPVTLDNLASRYDIASLADYFLTPTPPMPRYDLDAEQRRQLAHYLLSRDR